MYLPGDLTISKAIQNDMLGTVRVPTTAHMESASRSLPRPTSVHTVCPTCLRTSGVA